MKKIISTLLLVFFMYSCSNTEITELKKEISSLKEKLEKQENYYNNISCSTAVHSFLAYKNSWITDRDLIFQSFQYFYSNKKWVCVAIIEYKWRNYLYTFWEKWFNSPITEGEKSFEKLDEYSDK